MAQYAGSDNFPASFAEVDDGTARDAASVNVGLEALADRTIWLNNHKIGDTGNYTLAGDITFDGDVLFNQSVLFNGPVDIQNDLSLGSGFDILYNPPTGKVTSFVLSELPNINIAGDVGWSIVNGIGTVDAQVNAGLAPHFAYWYPKLPELTITDVFVYITPATSHIALPVNMPSVAVAFIKLSDGSNPPTYGATDGSVTLLAYQQRHVISVSGINYAFDPASYRMNVRLTTESGPNATGVFKVNGVRIAVKRFKYD